MGFQRVLSFVLVVLLALSSVSPVLAAEDTYTVLFKNVTGEEVTVTLIGPQRVTVTLGTKGQQIKMLAGTYNYSYQACGRTFTGVLKVNRNRVEFFLKKCASAQNNSSSDKLIKLVIINKTGATLNFVFIGAQTYRFTIPAGKTPIELQKGRYQWGVSGAGCGDYISDSGNINIRAGYSWTWYCK